MMNTRIHYLYRDADNYKVQNECVILGERNGSKEMSTTEVKKVNRMRGRISGPAEKGEQYERL